LGRYLAIVAYEFDLDPLALPARDEQIVVL